MKGRWTALYAYSMSLYCAHTVIGEAIGLQNQLNTQLQQEVRAVQRYDVGTEAHQDISTLTLYDRSSWNQVEGQFGQGVFGSTTRLRPNSWW